MIREPRCAPGLSLFRREDLGSIALTVIAALILVALGIALGGCGPTSPRFRSGDSRSLSGKGAGVRTTKDSVRVGADDAETTSDARESVLSGSRSFKTEKNASISNLDQAKMMREISKMMGVSYKLGGIDENGIDCSAYTMIVYKNSLRKLLPRSCAEQYATGIPVQSEDLKFGDLVFFNTTGEPASHVGIYLGDDLFAHASVSLGVTISSLDSYYFKKRYNGARRIIQ